MIIKNVTQEDLEKALEITNRKFENNITWNRFEKIGRNRYRVTLRVKDSRKAGHRIGYTGRRLINACWHVHGTFFDALLSVNPEAEIIALNRVINKEGGNWEDIQVGSVLCPRWLSEMCECYR